MVGVVGVKEKQERARRWRKCEREWIIQTRGRARIDKK
jgi:hypothetical protein